MKFKLKTKLTLSYILIAMLCIFLISFISNVYLERNFKIYVVRNLERKTSEIVNSISQQYDSNKGWNKKAVKNIGLNALDSGIIMEVTDYKSGTVWDAIRQEKNLCQNKMMQMDKNMRRRYRNWQGEYIFNTYSIIYEGESIGEISLGYYGPYYYTDSDILFISTLNKVFITVGVISFIISIIIGTMMSKRMSRPIIGATNTAQSIAKGFYDHRSKEKSNAIEINHLINSINDLAMNLESQEKLRKQLTMDIAHELRTPLTTLQGYIEGMIDGIWEADEHRLKGCHDEVIRLNRLLDDLDKLSKFESDNLILKKTEFNFGQLIRSVVKNFENEFKSKNIDYSLNMEYKKILADKDKISQMIINLISNAIKYTPDGGRISFSLARNGDFLDFIVEDSGIGIQEKDLPYIFERFYRADKSRNRMTGGAGIGLAITKAIVEAHGGSIKVESEYNIGSKFTVSLPRERN